MNRLVCLLLPCLALPVLLAEDKPAAPKGVRSVTASFHPAEAKPGQTVTLRLTVELADGYYTYPLAQTDPKAAGMVNKLTFPDPGTVVFVGEAFDPPNPKSKAEPILGIKDMKTYSGKVVYERKAVVNPSAKAGLNTVTLQKFVLSVCDENSCFPPKTLMPVVTLTVLDSPAVPVEEKYAAEVKTASEKK